MLALVDVNYRFTYIYVEVGEEGWLGDGDQWQSSKLKAAIAKNKLHLPPPSSLPGINIQLLCAIIGDDAFALDEHMLKPFNRQKMDRKQQIFTTTGLAE